MHFCSKAFQDIDNEMIVRTYIHAIHAWVCRGEEKRVADMLPRGGEDLHEGRLGWVGQVGNNREAAGVSIVKDRDP